MKHATLFGLGIVSLFVLLRAGMGEADENAPSS